MKKKQNRQDILAYFIQQISIVSLASLLESFCLSGWLALVWFGWAFLGKIAVFNMALLFLPHVRFSKETEEQSSCSSNEAQR